MKYQLHPACAAWPEMPPEALHDLADDIAANGLREPLTLTPDELLLDGRNRALACDLAGVEPTTIVYGGDPVLFSLSKNKHRRHMSADQIAMVAAALVTTTLGANRFVGVANATSTIDAAKASGVRVDEIKSAKAVLDHGTPEEIGAVKAGKAKLRATANVVRARRKNSIANARAVVRPAVERGETVDADAAAKEADVGRRTLNAAVALERERKAALDEIGVSPDDLSLTARKKFDLLEKRLRADIEIEIARRVKDGVAAALAKREAADIETIAQANELLAASRGRVKPPFTAGEFTGVLLRALHPDTSTPETQLAAFKLVNSKKLLLRDDGPIKLTGSPLPTDLDAWRAARTKAKDRKARKQ